ncbi:MAG: MbcA/ParS/Xre antitoxin family protein [Rudanella sp.]|nr:MbcA/ParS/Xre antitoxin family protein [Rudanella sp.]
MELTIKVDDKEGPFLIELLKKFPFVQEVSTVVETLSVVRHRSEELWQLKGNKLFNSRADFNAWLAAPNSAIKQKEPLYLLLDESGYQTVIRLLGRLEHGIMA